MLDMTTLTRWERAAQRALAADLPHQLRRRGQAVLVPSRSQAGTVYHVVLREHGRRVGFCDCAAALAGKPCTHRAAVALRLFERDHPGVRVVTLKSAGALALEAYL